MKRHFLLDTTHDGAGGTHNHRRVGLPASEVAAMAPVAKTILIELFSMIAGDDDPGIVEFAVSL